MSFGSVGRRLGVAAVAAFLALTLILVATAVITLRRPFPGYAGEVEVAGLGGQVEVMRDAQGVPQIYADTSADLFYAQGYVQAQDRFFQMDLRRHMTAGRVSELLGENPDALEMDKVVRTLGWRVVAERELPLLSAETRANLQAFSDGVNAYVKGRSAGELSASYSILGVVTPLKSIEPWTSLDSLTWLKAMAWQLRSNYDDELGRGLAFNTFGGKVDLIDALYPPYDTTNAPIVSAASGSGAPARRVAAPAAEVTTALRGPGNAALARVSKALNTIPAMLGGRAGDIGSNSWVVSGRFTTTGKPLLANDPHLAPELPSIWSQVGLHCRTVGSACPYDVSGFGFAGMPGVVVGHNASIAWGVTNLYGDVTDFFLEQVKGDTVLVDGAWKPLTKRTETINVAGGSPVELTVRSTSHGPILSDAIDSLEQLGSTTPVNGKAQAKGSDYAVSLAWTALTPGRTMDAVFALDKATDFEQFRAAAKLFEVPAQNLIYADTKGHIGYQAPGRFPIRSGTGVGQATGTWPRPGWDSSWNWKGTVPFDQLPSALDPAEGFIVAANQEVSASGPFLSADFDYGYRSQRIRTLIREKGKLDVAAMSAIQLDERHPFADELIPYLMRAPIVTSVVNRSAASVSPEYVAEAVQLLRTWDRVNAADSAGAAYYNAVWSNLVRLTFDDQLPPNQAADGGERYFAVMHKLLTQPESPFWDDVTTPKVVETRDQILGEALYAARVELTVSLGKDPAQWQWGRLHTLQLKDMVLGGDGVPAPIRSLYRTDRFEMSGGGGMVNANSWSASEPRDYTVTAVPSMRMVVDLNDLNASRWVDLTGVSGHPRSGHYTDQLETWLKGETYAWPFTADAVKTATRDSLVLKPAS